MDLTSWVMPQDWPHKSTVSAGTRKVSSIRSGSHRFALATTWWSLWRTTVNCKAQWRVSGDVPTAQGSRHPMIAPSETFMCADGKPLVISPTGEVFWQKFCAAIERPDLITDDRFATAGSRIQNVEVLAQVLSDVFKQKPRDEWADQLFQRRIPAAPVLDVAEALAQPLSLLRSMVESVTDSTDGNELPFLGNPFKFDDARPLEFPPHLGADTDEVLTRLCGYDKARLAQLKSKKAIFHKE